MHSRKKTLSTLSFVALLALTERKRTQAPLTLLSTNGKQIIVPSGHNMHLEAPDAVADAIQDVKNSCEHPKQPAH